MDHGFNISDDQFAVVSKLMHEKTGVFLKASKKMLVLSRLRSRFVELGIKNFGDYLNLLVAPKMNTELEFFINTITTNETHFFRHMDQFEILYENILPELIEKKRSIKNGKIKIWSAACSSGEEPYSLAIVCNEFSLSNPSFFYEIYASDVNSRVLNDAKIGVYGQRSLRETPLEIVKKYFVETSIIPKHPLESKYYEVSQYIKDKVKFCKHNLMEPFKNMNADVIFIRNAMIYFSTDTKQRVVSLLENNLLSNGYLFISLSESLNDIKTGLKLMKTGIYQKL